MYLKKYFSYTNKIVHPCPLTARRGGGAKPQRSLPLRMLFFVLTSSEDTLIHKKGNTPKINGRRGDKTPKPLAKKRFIMNGTNGRKINQKGLGGRGEYLDFSGSTTKKNIFLCMSPVSSISGS